MLPNKAGAKARGFSHWSRDRWEAQLESGIRRFWARVNRSGDCWEWTGQSGIHGYGQVSFLGRPWTTHRLSYWLTNGYIELGHDVCHTCDNRRCVRPDHLFTGTRSDNVHDMYAKGRENRPIKFTDKEIAAIRRLEADGLSRRRIAELFGVSHSYVGELVRGEKRGIA